jgi:uncharacterized cupin superfamily protein
MHDRKHITRPDEVRLFEHGHADILRLSSGDVTCGTFEPEWRWCNDVKPIEGTVECEVHHTGYVMSGQMHIAMTGGEDFEIAAGDVVDIPPGHDAWVVGNEACVMLDWGGAANYARRN